MIDDTSFTLYQLFYGDAHYPRGGFADYKGSFYSLDIAKQAADTAFESELVDWVEVVNVSTCERVYGVGQSCCFNFETSKVE